MARLKKRYWFLLSFFLIIGLFIIGGWQYWISIKQKYDIALDWQGLNVSFDGISFEEITLSQQKTTIVAKNINLSLAKLSVKDLSLYLPQDDDPITAESTDKQISDSEQPPEQSGLDLATLATVFYWMPTTIHVDSFKLYQQHVPILDIKIDTVKQQQSLKLDISTDKPYLAYLSGNLLLNQTDSHLEIQQGLFTTTLNQLGIENGNITLPFSATISQDQVTLTNLDNGSVSVKKAQLTEDLMVNDLTGSLQFKIQFPLLFELNQLSATGQLAIHKANGIYKNSDIKSVSGAVNLSLKNNQFNVSTSALNIQEVNLGVIFQKIKLAGQYSASLNSPSKGLVTWTKAQAALFSGTLLLDAGKLNLAKLPQQLKLRLKNIQLQDVFTQYPAEGLDAKGTIEGYLPITLLTVKNNGKNSLGIVIKNGELTTVNDGYLRFDNATLKEYAQANPNIKILTDIIKNFHYTKLAGTVYYSNGIAKLGLNIQGNNLDAENGKALNLNLNLEENVANLLMSMQLSDQISEPIRKRIEAHLNKKR
ncbi:MULTISPECIES: intermembrane phospholipid transport protein YdbH family protein [unclassified Gilliamella]|uniref:intermembrane phospholipid transport protein YdbH family protein n=1 Tax=unclassified Gilliamella TaxID=2685620 RepID=UPI00226A869C|nr:MULTISPECIES: YdbH domain-containing protein [unclassified Gilliamella]MCX8602116.1 YdbH domain-containing protein [Gilliamella sp. B3722]MCX8611410.1 YdbH domain-containing protein [Gilliamella sp. B3891]MCX8613759.1 YdbH domain-containing protein [Gilliamella sp. B3773]MCX8615156.1 YdbH domain-containing protein [Gilliamella sp. B3770]MCX8621039.1 YdbH domain-containing protein [Gilliamella sp. B3892]